MRATRDSQRNEKRGFSRCPSREHISFRFACSFPSQRKLPINKMHASVQISCRYENRARATQSHAGFTARIIFSSLGASVRSFSISRLSLPFRSPSLKRHRNPPLVSPERRAHPRKCASHSTRDFSPTGLLQAECLARVIIRKSVANRVIVDAIICR